MVPSPEASAADPAADRGEAGGSAVPVSPLGGVETPPGAPASCGHQQLTVRYVRKQAQRGSLRQCHSKLQHLPAPGRPAGHRRHIH